MVIIIISSSKLVAEAVYQKSVRTAST